MQLIIIVKKEILNLVRDKKAFLALFLPLILFPLIFGVVGEQLKDAADDVEKTVKIYSNIQTNKEKTAYVSDMLLDDINIMFIDTDNPEETLKSGEIYLIIDFENENVSNFPISVTLKYNANSTLSTRAYSVVSAELDIANTKKLSEYLSNVGIDPSVTQNIFLNAESLSTNSFLVLLAPMLIVSLLISGGASIAVDAFAGEKERGTLERIAVTQVGRTTLLIGKMISVFSISLLSSFISVLAYLISIKISPEMVELLGNSGATTALSANSIIAIVLIILTFSMLISSLLVLISLCAKSAKGAQSNIGLVGMIPSVISLLIMFMSTESQSDVAMTIPIYNTIVGLKMAFSDAISISSLTVCVGSQILYFAILFAVCKVTVSHDKNMF